MLSRMRLNVKRLSFLQRLREITVSTRHGLSDLGFEALSTGSIASVEFDRVVNSIEFSFRSFTSISSKLSGSPKG
jgi:hypothetical protein